MIAEIEAEYKSDAESTKTPLTLPLQGSYGVSFVNIWEKIDRIIL